MARFGQQVVQGLINPSFGQGLFDLGTAIGSAPRRAREEAEKKAKEEQLKSIMQLGTAAATTGDPTNLARVAQRLSQIPGMEQQAMAAAKLAREASEKMQKKETTAKTGRGKGELMALANNPEFNIMDQKQQAGYLGMADSYGVSREEAMEIAMQSKKEKGSEAKGYKVEKDVVIDGKVKSVVEFFDADGEFLSRKVIGEVAPEEGDKDKPFMETKAGSDLYQAAVTERNSTTSEIQKFDSIINEAEKLAGEPIPIIGGILGATRDFVVSDIAGLGDEITAFRTSLNEIQMQKALALLPKGPASDRDVQLALNASPDLKNYNEEERLAALRGMKKILEARKQYIEGKVRWMEVTNDANAVGYERYAEIKGFDRNIENLKTKFPTAIKELDSIISEARTAKQGGDEVTYEELIRQAEEIDSNLVVGKDRFGNDIKGLGYIDTLKNRGNSRRLLDKTLENKNLTFEDISYV